MWRDLYDHLALGRRSLRMLLVAAVAAGAALATSAPAALAAETPDFAASAAPLSYGGNDYVDLFSGGGSGAVFITASAAGTTEVTADGTPIPGIPGDPGLSDYDVALIRSDGAYITIYIDAARLEYYDGGPFAHSCSGITAFLTSWSGGGVNAICDNYAKTILKPNATFEDFTFTGYGNFEYPGTVAAVAGFSDPALTFIGALPPYYASATPLSFGGTDYNGMFIDSSNDNPKKEIVAKPPSAPLPTTSGALWAIDFDADPQFVVTDNTRIAGIRDGDELVEIDVVLLTIKGANVTTYISSDWRAPSSKAGPYEASCAGFVSFLTDRGKDGRASDGYICGNFKAGIFTPNGPGNDFTFTGFDGFNKAGAVAAVSGFSSPPWLTRGPYTPRATTTTTAAPVATTTTTTAGPATTTTTAAPAATSTAAPVASTTLAPAAAILPVTGSDGRPGVTVVAIALLAAGFALQRGARSRREASPEHARTR